MESFQTLRQQIEALPEPERSARRAFYTEAEWNSWELNAFPHQLPPLSNDWMIWSITGGRRTGKTTAGVKWAANALSYNQHVGVVTYYANQIESLVGLFMREHDLRYMPFKGSHSVRLELKKGQGAIDIHPWRPSDRGGMLRGHDYTYLWGDELGDPGEIIQETDHSVMQYCFTSPARIPEG